jgi:hypothetical protein
MIDLFRYLIWHFNQRDGESQQLFSRLTLGKTLFIERETLEAPKGLTN